MFCITIAPVYMYGNKSRVFTVGNIARLLTCLIKQHHLWVAFARMSVGITLRCLYPLSFKSFLKSYVLLFFYRTYLGDLALSDAR